MQLKTSFNFFRELRTWKHYSLKMMPRVKIFKTAKIFKSIHNQSIKQTQHFDSNRAQNLFYFSNPPFFGFNTLFWLSFVFFLKYNSEESPPCSETVYFNFISYNLFCSLYIYIEVIPFIHVISNIFILYTCI